MVTGSVTQLIRRPNRGASIGVADEAGLAAGAIGSGAGRSQRSGGRRVGARAGEAAGVGAVGAPIDEGRAATEVPIDGGAVRKEDPAREGSMQVRVLDLEDVEISEDGEVYLEGRLVLGNVHADFETGVVVVEAAV